MTASLFALTFFAARANGALVIHGVLDGDLPGGNPKAILLSATADVADLSIYGVGASTNGGGTNGEEFSLSGTATAGDILVVAGNSASQQFFSSYFSNTLFQNGSAIINGDDAVELFENGIVIDTYGDPNVDGSGETWEYEDGFAVRVMGTAGAFDQANYTSTAGGLDGFDEQMHIDTIGSTFGLTAVAVPEPSSVACIGGLFIAAVLKRRREVRLAPNKMA
ncbi:PEP-CTERM sorting domain-containing protein [Rhodopirellula halodulae]|uniref:PEP-CTERM sorting domain-containing protein n=1 Tax=Rhodopirellula halodulae TaxID=2894198 RepID=UPI001E41AE79|nr:PEP-CTERM sorting domain-containing protein [Rhodopirellula sp. JC737]